MPEHASDCALHNAPALPVGPCDCAAHVPAASEKVEEHPGGGTGGVEGAGLGY